MLDDTIQSDISAAEATKESLTRELGEYSATSFEEVSSKSDGLPPSSHDTCTGSSGNALQKYHEAITRDANVVVNIAKSFEDTDNKISEKLLSTSEVG